MPPNPCSPPQKPALSPGTAGFFLETSIQVHNYPGVDNRGFFGGSMPSDNNGKFRSRKFGLACAAFLVSNVYLVGGLLDGTQFVQLVFAVLSMYAAGSVGDKFAAGKKP